MRLTRLYTEQALQPDSEVCLSQEQAHYLSHVLRLRQGNPVILFNGEDREYEAVIEALTKRQARLKVFSAQPRQTESSLNLTLGVGVSRGQHMDVSLQKAVELGVQTIVPVLTEFSNVKLKQDRIENKMRHWQGIVINATEQCGRTRLAELAEPVEFGHFIEGYQDALRLMLHPTATTPFADIAGKPDNVCVLIGPEGGFSETETRLAQQQGYALFRFGPRILRAETAVIAAVAGCQGRWGDLFY